jgi:tRNA U34 5-methylaminomethyl-2-thiouridine-forming methyltransferase MnmC
MQLIVTADGSHTLIDEQFCVTFHSTFGAIQESQHVYINAGLKSYFENSYNKNVVVFEMGFGTGLNALLSAMFANDNCCSINYIALDNNPINEEIGNKINYGILMKEELLYSKIITGDWNQKLEINSNFYLTKIHDCLTKYNLANQSIDVIFFDAFAPDIQPQLWEQVIFEKMFMMLKPKGMLVTYCSKTIVRKTLELVGFTVSKLTGPPGKREIICAIKN